jgi:FAD/FMN-containing dehydrogenase
MAAAVERVLYDGLRELGGSFSAEHGIGSKRIHSLLATADETKLATMERVKKALDGQSLMNPDKVLPGRGWVVRSSNPPASDERRSQRQDENADE